VKSVQPAAVSVILKCWASKALMGQAGSPLTVAQGTEMLLQTFHRIVAWLMLSIIVVLTVVPPAFRPSTSLPHEIEHAAIFLAAGTLFGMAYLGREWTLSVRAFVFCAAIEAAQLYVPGRHARLSDFAVDATAAAFGIFVGRLLSRTRFFPR
jgi:VanZ family protein